MLNVDEDVNMVIVDTEIGRLLAIIKILEANALEDKALEAKGS